MFKNGFPNRSWTDAEKWLLSIVSALLITFVIWITGTINEESGAELEKKAVILGYKSALALAKSNLGQDIDSIKAEIDQRILEFGINHLAYPDNPSEDSGASAQTFVEQTAGKLLAINEHLAHAFSFGWHGFINTNTPGTFPDFNTIEAAKALGYSVPAGATDKNVYELIIERANE